MDPNANMEVISDADILPQHENDICQLKPDESAINDTESPNTDCVPNPYDPVNNEISLCSGSTKEQSHNIDNERKLLISTSVAVTDAKGEENKEINTVHSVKNDHAKQSLSTVADHITDNKGIDEKVLEPESTNSNSFIANGKETMLSEAPQNNILVGDVAEITIDSARSADDNVQKSPSVKIMSSELEGEDHTDKINEKNLLKVSDSANESNNTVSDSENTERSISDIPEVIQVHTGTVSGSLSVLEADIDGNTVSKSTVCLGTADDTNTISKATKTVQESLNSDSATIDSTLTNKLETLSDKNTKIRKTAGPESSGNISITSVHKDVLTDLSNVAVNKDHENVSKTTTMEETSLESTEISFSLNPIEDESTLSPKNPNNNRSEEIIEEECTHTSNNLKASEVSEIPSNAMDTSDKDMAGKSNMEPENTEFVQFSQDKHEDSQIEAQTMDAEDPFGGDNLPSECTEPMEVDEDVGFSKLSRQTNNLQDPINVGLGDLNESHTINDNVHKQISVINDTPSKSYQNEEDVSASCNEAAETSKHVQKTNKPLNEQTDLTDQMKNDDIQKHTADTMDTEQSQSDILPGQDDELCIIPDSMKVILPEKKKDKNETKSTQSVVNTTNSKDISKEECKDRSELTCNNTDKISDTENKTVVESRKEADKKESALDAINKKPTDVINIDEESKNSEIEEITAKEICMLCNEEKSCKIKVKIGSDSYNVCSKTCKTLFNIANNKATDIPSDGVNSKHEKRCASCLLIIEPNEEKNLSWETMEFCNEACLGKFQTKYGSYCRNCNGSVQAVSLGKYCVRFGYVVRQFCCSSCLEEFKKGLKVCSYCQKDISSGTEGFLAPVGDKGQFKDFCKQDCMEKYSKMSSTEPVTTEKKCCSVCQKEKLVYCEVQLQGTSPVAICSEPCLAAFKFVNKVDPEQCSTCKKFFELLNKRAFIVFYENEARTFCSKTCLNVFIITNRKIVPCNWCKVKKYNFDMIKKELKSGQVMMMCSLNCLTLYQVSINAVSAKRINCDYCKEFSQAQYHLTMSDATIRNFCSYNCVMNFQAQYTKSPITIPSSDDPVPTGMPKRTLPSRNEAPITSKTNEIQNKKNMPVISSVTSLAEVGNGQVSPKSQQNNTNNIVVSSNTVMQNQNPQVIYKQQVITRPPSPVKLHNKMTQCKPLVHTKGVSVRPHPCTKSTQTDEVQQVLVPIPVPIYVPFPMHMYSMPYPVPMPFPLPIPVPIFIPTTKNSAKGIFKDIKRIQEKIPADPFEAELLMMAEMVATEKKANDSDSDSADDRDDAEVCNDNSRDFSPEVDSGNTFGEDMLQMALKMATGELDEPAVDLEAALTPNTITATQTSSQSESAIENDVQSERLVAASRGRKRIAPYKTRAASNKRGRRASGTHEIPLMQPPEPQPLPQPRIMEPIEKPDANMALKYTFGVNAWRQWVIAKNAELEKQNTTTRRIKLFKTDLLQLTADELNYSLCLFVKEVKKPNGTEYAPDTIYYLCLGIQQYLFENNRIDNIFTDSYYEKFTDCLNDVAKKFSVLYHDAQYIVTRVEEEHLWECKQLGAHSPHVLLSTLMFFNTKHFNLITVEEHMQLSFSHIMKHWKRNPAAQPTAAAAKVPGSRNVLLRFYPPQSALEGNSRKKKVYEQQENEENPLRCPVKLYEFYLSKCPESVKTRNDVFYLLPERSCVPDSPVWYSTSPLAKEHLIKMLYRIKMVKEINVALLTS